MPPRIFDAPDGFVFHHLNAWEQNDEVAVESIYYKDFPSIRPNEDFKNIDFNSIPEGLLKRCTINLSNNETKTSQLSNQCCEFAMVNPEKQGIRARFSWMAIADSLVGKGPRQGIKKLDLLTQKQLTWSTAPRGFVNEPLFIPKINSINEDEGYVILLTWNGETRNTEVVILNAQNLKEEAVLKSPINIAYGLHGSWVNS